MSLGVAEKAGEGLSIDTAESAPLFPCDAVIVEKSLCATGVGVGYPRKLEGKDGKGMRDRHEQIEEKREKRGRSGQHSTFMYCSGGSSFN